MVTGGRTGGDWLVTVIMAIPLLTVGIVKIPAVAVMAGIAYGVTVVTVVGWLSYHLTKIFLRTIKKEAERISNE
jgi:hypothetical protein